MSSILDQVSQHRVVLLYRASTKKQTDSENDIPLQRNILRPWADERGQFICEFVEGGVSGFKESATKRDAIISIKAMADRQEFDILGVYMSDRLGRIADETPLIVSYLNARGVKVISYCEGEISSKTHVDKLITYIRYWQAEAESLKTSQRITDAVEQNVRQGKWRGGNPPYGYMTVSRGTLNFKGKPIFDIVIDTETSEIVKDVFRLYKDHYGIKGIAKYLNDRNVPTKNGVLWEAKQIKNILRNKLYIGIYELGKTTNVRLESPTMEHLRIISEHEFYEVQELLNRNSSCRMGQRPTIRGSRLLNGLLFCECGRKYTSQIYRKYDKNENELSSSRATYRCMSFRTPKEKQCDKKQFAATVLERLVIEDAKKFMSELDIDKLLILHKEKLYRHECETNEELNIVLQKITNKERELKELKEKISNLILNGSQFSEELFLSIIQVKESELEDLFREQDIVREKASKVVVKVEQYNTVNNNFGHWLERFDMQDIMGKKSMLVNIIDKIVIMGHNITVAYKINSTGLCDSGERLLVGKGSPQQKTLLWQ